MLYQLLLETEGGGISSDLGCLLCMIPRFDSTVSKPTSNISAILMCRDSDVVEGLVVKTSFKGPLFGDRDVSFSQTLLSIGALR